MNWNELWTTLSQLDVKVWAEEDQLGIDAPKGVLTLELRNALLEHKAEILSFLRQGNMGSSSAKEALPIIANAPEQRFDPFPLTDIQQAYWVGRGDAFELGQVATHGYLEIECLGVDLARLNLAWQKVIERHEMLRAVVLPTGEQQILAQVPPYNFEVLDLTGLDATVVTAALSEVRAQMSHQVFPTDQWPLFEIRVTRFDHQRFRLHLSLDILMVDWGSLIRLSQEWAALYQEPLRAFPRLELSFRDYVLAMKKLESSDLYQRSQAYWQARRLPPAPELPLAYLSRPQTGKPRFTRRPGRLDVESWQLLKQRASQVGLTPSGILLAAFAEVLTTWSKSPRFTINLTLFNRLPLHPQVNDIVGDFTSVILLAVDNGSNGTFADRAKQLQQQLWQDLEHRHFSGVRVLREEARREGAYKLMPVVFTSALGLGEASLFDQFGELVYGISQTPQVWLDHVVREQEGALAFHWDVVEECFPPALLDDMFAAYCHLLERLASGEAWHSPRPQLVPPTQLSRRAAVNVNIAPVSGEMLHTLFIAQVEPRADEVAVISPQCTLTYQQLYQLANQVGHKLRQLGSKPNTLVAVVMEKGWEQVVAVLGILISGAAYLPIDPNLPAERRQYLFEQAEVKVVLTQPKLNQRLEWPATIKRLSVPTDFVQMDNSPLELVQSHEDLAYVIYTSGSTGLPKGVVIDHRGAVNTVLDINQRFEVGPDDRVLALSALNFDLSVYDIFGLLAAGGTIVFPEASLQKDPAHWAELMVRHQVTLWNTVPALMQILVESLSARSEGAPLRLVMMSGDWIPVNLPDQIRGLFEHAQLISLGGATEASIWSITYPIGEVDPSWKSIPYGKPLTNQSFHVLNELMEPCPIWVPGQLYIGGIGLAKEYWRNKEKTNESFIIHPQTKERLYKTGDLGRYILSGEKDLGNIEFLGREDLQVKIRGHRIELGEIEANLLRHPAVKEAVVSAIGVRRFSSALEREKLAEGGAGVQLVAYVVADESLSAASEMMDYVPKGIARKDKYERMAFKLKQPGLRTPEADQTIVPLQPREFDEALIKSYLTRQSYRQFLRHRHPISFEQFSDFLSCLRQLALPDNPLPKYRYPSAGTLYPVQSYLYIKPDRVEGVAGGFYYYDPANHRLLLTSRGTLDDGYGPNQPIFSEAAFALFLVGQLAAITPMYGEFAERFCLLEAGYMGQLLMTEAPTYQIGLCPIGHLESTEGPESDLSSRFLEETHVLLHSFVGGQIDPLQSTYWGQQPTGEAVPSEQLRDYLAQKLPAYMVPSTYLFLDALPLTANGKVDRKALPLPDVARFETRNAVPPRTPLEKEVAAIMQDMLEPALSLPKGQTVGLHDNFFELGGDSLMAIQLLSRLRNAFEIEYPLRDFFDTPTVERVAKFIERVRQATQSLQDISTAMSGDREEGEL